MRYTDTRYQILRKTQVAIYQRSGVGKEDLEGIVQLLNPEVMADHLGLKYTERDHLGPSKPGFETAGMLDVATRNIYVSRKFPTGQRRLTGMHEVVHWVLHRNDFSEILHRDRPIDGLLGKKEVNEIEWEATRIACLCLMPERLVKTYFSGLFQLPYGQPLEFDENVAFYLGTGIEVVRSMSVRDRALQLATTHKYGRPVRSLCEFFKISPTAMAIRLEELNLIAPDRRRGKPDLRIV